MVINPSFPTFQQRRIPSNGQRKARERTIERCVKMTQSAAFLALSTFAFNYYSEFSSGACLGNSFMSFPYVVCGTMKIVMGTFAILGVASAAMVWVP